LNKCIAVTNKSQPQPIGYSIIYIGRGSVFGNPFVMQNQTIRERERVCDQYLIHLKAQWKLAQQGNENELAMGIVELAKRVKQGERIALQCFCAPKQCHGDTLKKTIEWLVEKS
jgi:hypothetical protein